MKYNRQKNAPVLIYAMLSESRVEQFQERIATLPFKVSFRDEKRGPLSVTVITSAPSQEGLVRNMLNELGFSEEKRLAA